MSGDHVQDRRKSELLVEMIIAVLQFCWFRRQPPASLSLFSWTSMRVLVKNSSLVISKLKMKQKVWESLGNYSWLSEVFFKFLVAEHFWKIKCTYAVVQQNRGKPEWAGMSHKESRMLSVVSEEGPESGEFAFRWKPLRKKEIFYFCLSILIFL